MTIILENNIGENKSGGKRNISQLIYNSINLQLLLPSSLRQYRNPIVHVRHLDLLVHFWGILDKQNHTKAARSKNVQKKWEMEELK